MEYWSKIISWNNLFTPNRCVRIIKLFSFRLRVVLIFNNTYFESILNEDQSVQRTKGSLKEQTNVIVIEIVNTTIFFYYTIYKLIYKFRI